jgi:hypothetical protein
MGIDRPCFLGLDQITFDSKGEQGLVGSNERHHGHFCRRVHVPRRRSMEAICYHSLFCRLRNFDWISEGPLHIFLRSVREEVDLAELVLSEGGIPLSKLRKSAEVILLIMRCSEHGPAGTLRAKHDRTRFRVPLIRFCDDPHKQEVCFSLRRRFGNTLLGPSSSVETAKASLMRAPLLSCY